MPPFLDRLSKGVTKAADQAKFEAEKLRKTTALNNEISKLKQQVAEAKAAIGEKVIELKAEGVSFPELDAMVQTVDELGAQAAAKEEELAALKAMEYQASEAAVPPTEPTAPEAAPAGAAKFCPNCGAKIADGAKFCPECGTKTA